MTRKASDALAADLDAGAHHSERTQNGGPGRSDEFLHPTCSAHARVCARVRADARARARARAYDVQAVGNPFSLKLLTLLP